MPQDVCKVCQPTMCVSVCMSFALFAGVHVLALRGRQQPQRNVNTASAAATANAPVPSKHRRRRRRACRSVRSRWDPRAEHARASFRFRQV